MKKATSCLNALQCLVAGWALDTVWGGLVYTLVIS